MKDHLAISRDALLASLLNNILNVVMGDELAEMSGYKGLAIATEALKPKTLENEGDHHLALLLLVVVKISGDMETEAELLQLLKPTMDRETFVKLAAASYPFKKGDESFLYRISEQMLPLMVGAGLEDLKTSFAELDSLIAEATV